MSPILLVEDNEHYLRFLTQLFQPEFPLICIRDPAEAIEASPELELAAAVIDLHLGRSAARAFGSTSPSDMDWAGFAVLEAVRQWHRSIPTVLHSGYLCDPEVINRAHRLGATPVAKAEGSYRNLLLFKESLLQTTLTIPGLEQFGRKHRLTRREKEVVAAAVRDPHRRAVAAELGLSEQTVKEHVREILKKTGETSLRRLAYRLRDGRSTS